MARKASFVGANTVKDLGLFSVSVRPADWMAATRVLSETHRENMHLTLKHFQRAVKNVTAEITKRSSIELHICPNVYIELPS